MAEEVLGDGEDIFPALAQRRHLDAALVEAVEEIGTKTARGDGFFELLVSSGYDAHIDRDLLAPADTVIGDAVEDAQQFDLNARFELADFVEQEGAGMGEFEEAGAGGIGTAESPALVPEKLGFHEVFGEGAAVEIHPRPGGARRVVVHGAGDDFLACSGFAGNQDGNGHPRDSRDGLHQEPHARAGEDGRNPEIFMLFLRHRTYLSIGRMGKSFKKLLRAEWPAAHGRRVRTDKNNMGDAFHTVETLALAVDARFSGRLPGVLAALSEITHRLGWSDADAADLRAAALLRSLDQLAGGQGCVGSGIARDLGMGERVLRMLRGRGAEILALADGRPAESAKDRAPEYRAAIAMAGRSERVTAQLARELAGGCGFHQVLASVAAALTALLGCESVAVYPAAESGARDPASAPWFRVGSDGGGAAILAPLKSETGNAAWVVARRTAEFGTAEKEALETMCALAGPAVVRARRFEELERTAGIDELTRLPNSRSLFLRLDAELSRCRRSQSRLAVLVCDAAAAPPAAYPAIADRLREVCREEDCVARFGEGFALVLVGFSCDGLAEKERAIAAAVREAAGGAVPRFGAAFYPDDGAEAEDLLAAADRRMASV